METVTIIFTIWLATEYCITKFRFRQLEMDIKSHHNDMEKNMKQLETRITQLKERLLTTTASTTAQ